MLLANHKMNDCGNRAYQTIMATEFVAKIANVRAKILVLSVVCSILAILLGLAGFCLAETGYRSHFLAYGPGVAAAGLGETFTAGGDDMSVIYYNPALLTKLNGDEISAMYWFLFDSARYNFIGFSSADERSAFAFAGTQFYRNNIEVRQNIDDTGENTINSQTAIYGAYSGFIKPWKLNYGLSLKWLNYKMYKMSGDGGGLDVGLARRLALFGSPIGKKITVDAGLIVRNPVQLGIKLIEEKERLPQTYKFGLDTTATIFTRYSEKNDALTYDTVSLGTDIEYTDNRLDYSLGLKYKFIDFLMLRAGWNQGITAGLGIILSGFQLDYAFMTKDFTNYHKAGFTYRYGQKELTPAVSPVLTEEFQKVYKQAMRIYDKYCNDAANATTQARYEDAVNLLKKAIPLKPSENQDTKQLLLVCDQSITANRVNIYLTDAKRYINAAKPVEAYKEYLKAFNANPEDKNIKMLIDNIYGKLKANEQATVNKLKDEYIQKVKGEVDFELWENDYAGADKVLRKLELFAPEEARESNRKIIDKKKLVTYKFLAAGLEKLKTSPAEAYDYFVEAEKLNPLDSSIKDQKKIAKKKYLSKRKFTFEDKLYADKLYYLITIGLATEENPVSTYNELKSFNAVYDYLPELEDTLREQGIITRRLP